MSDSSTSDIKLQNSCLICKKYFPRKGNLYRHLRVQHKNQGINDPIVVAKINSKVSCTTCHRKFSCATSLTRHIRTQHPEIQTVQKPQKKSRLICPADSCKELLTSYVSLRDHLSKLHDFNVLKETFTFESEKEFKDWKMNYEKSSGTYYVSNTGPKEVNGSTRTYYHCHCSYSYKPQGKNIRKIKNAGSKRKGTACPSTMNVIKTPHNINVEFWKNHFNCDSTGHIFLSKPERAQIAAKLQQGVSFECIIDDIKNGDLNKEGLQRMHLVERKDLHNIVRDYKITYAAKKHSNAAFRKHSNADLEDENSCSENESTVSASGSNTNLPNGSHKVELLAQQVIALNKVVSVSEDVEKKLSKALARIIDIIKKKSK